MSFRKDSQGKDLEFKVFDFKIEECKQADNGSVGIVKGYASTFDNVDRGKDIVAQGAFDRTILEHKQRHNRPIRLYAGHFSDDILGGIPIETVKVDSVGLFIEAHLDLNVKKAEEFFSLVKKGFISDFSIGFSVRKSSFDNETDIRTLLDIDLREVSLVNEPMNQLAVVTDVESGKQLEGSDVKKSEKNSDESYSFTNSKGKVITVDDEGNVLNVDANGKKNFDVKDVESLTSNMEVEELLKSAGFSKEARKTLISKVRKGFESDGRDDLEDDDGRDDQSNNRRDAENVKTLLSSLTDLKSTLTPIKTIED